MPKFLELNGPSGTYSHFWTSRALQSLSRTRPVSGIWDMIHIHTATRKEKESIKLAENVLLRVVDRNGLSQRRGWRSHKEGDLQLEVQPLTRTEKRGRRVVRPRLAARPDQQSVSNGVVAVSGGCQY